MSRTLPLWRSLLFVPAHASKFVDKAHQRGADACILDLEDSVPVGQKELARESIGPALQAINSRGTDVLVRINSLDSGGLLDLPAVVGPALRAVVVPKVAEAETVRGVDALLGLMEQQLGLPVGQILILAQIEDVAALPRLDEIAKSSPRLMGMSLGPEDFAVSAGMEALPETLFWPNQQVVFACRRVGILPLGFPGSIAEFSDLSRFRETVVLARQMGMVGAFCIHPDQATVLNEVLTPSTEAFEYAQGLLAEHANAEANGLGAFAYRGKMVDAPVVARARDVVSRFLAAEQRRKPVANQ